MSAQEREAAEALYDLAKMFSRGGPSVTKEDREVSNVKENDRSRTVLSQESDGPDQNQREVPVTGLWHEKLSFS